MYISSATPKRRNPCGPSMKLDGYKILIIEDEPSIRRLLRVSLQNTQAEIIDAPNAEEGVNLATQQKPNLILLDIGLPDQSGLFVIKKIREWSEIPIIILSVNDEEATKIEALDSGANDYLTKPFSVPELLARIRVALRPGAAAPHSPIIRCGSIEMDLTAHTVKVSGKAIKLTTTEYDLLRALLKNAEKVVTHRQLLKEVWGPNSVEHTQYLRVYLAQIRKKLGDPAGDQIQTEPGIGYRLVNL